jgi:hypothetical protein
MTQNKITLSFIYVIRSVVCVFIKSWSLKGVCFAHDEMIKWRGAGIGGVCHQQPPTIP